MTSVLVVQHLPHEHDGVLGEVLVRRGVAVTYLRAWEAPVPAEPTVHDRLVVLGGDMNTDEDERWPHLRAVRDLLSAAVEQRVPTLALCLGAQLLAEATGGGVVHGRPEIGYIPIEVLRAGRADPVLRALPDGARMFNAHADHLTPGPQATVLARSRDTEVHAFRVGRALGLQFHPEIDASYVAAYVEAPGVAAYLAANRWSGPALVTEARRHNETHRRHGAALFDAWLDST